MGLPYTNKRRYAFVQRTQGIAPLKKSDKDQCLVYTVPEAGALLGLKKNAAYEAAKRKDFPTVKFGKLIRVPKAAFHAMLERAGEK